MPGPVPKRAEQRRRRNKPETPITTAPSGGADDDVEIPPADPQWHPRVLALYESLAESGQSRFYEPSDWAFAGLLCEALSISLNSGRLSAQVLETVSSGLTRLLVTEGDRRRLRMELARGPQTDPDDEAADAAVLDLTSRLG